MDVIHIDKNDHLNHILCNDHIPNPAFINEFQTISFTLKLQSIEIIERPLEGYVVDEGGAFIIFYMEIRNNTNEIIEIYKDDFMLSINKNEEYNAEDYFGAKYQLKDQLLLKPFEIVKGCYIFVGERNIKRLDFFFAEYYDESYSKEYHLRYKFEKSV